MYIELSSQITVKGGLIDSKPFRRKHRSRNSFQREQKPSSLKNLDGKSDEKNAILSYFKFETWHDISLCYVSTSEFSFIYSG